MLLLAWGSLLNKALSAATGQVRQPGAVATVMVTPLQKGSVLDVGRVRCMCVASSKLEKN